MVSRQGQEDVGHHRAALQGLEDPKDGQVEQGRGEPRRVVDCPECHRWKIKIKKTMKDRKLVAAR